VRRADLWQSIIKSFGPLRSENGEEATLSERTASGKYRCHSPLSLLTPLDLADDDAAYELHLTTLPGTVGQSMPRASSTAGKHLKHSLTPLRKGDACLSCASPPSIVPARGIPHQTDTAPPLARQSPQSALRWETFVQRLCTNSGVCRDTTHSLRLRWSSYARCWKGEGQGRETGRDPRRTNPRGRVRRTRR
jgi:hypothetical protein